MADNKLFKIPRSVLARMTQDNPQAIRALENIQKQVGELLPTTIAEIIEQAASEAQQASMIANQLRQEFTPYLPAVGVPVSPDMSLQAVSVSMTQDDQLNAVSAPCECVDSLPAV